MKNAGCPRKVWIIAGMALCIVIPASLHAYWLFTYSGGVYQEDTAILSPAVDYLQLIEAYGEVYRNPESIPAQVRPTINATWVWKNLVVAPYRRAFLIYPPLPSLAVAASLALGGGFPNAPFLPVFLYLPILVVGTYLLARRFTTPPTALFAAMILPLFPGSYFLERQLYAAYPMTAVLVCVYALWWWSGKLSKPSRSLVMGFAMGVLLLIKHTASPFLLLPAAWTIWEVYRDYKTDRDTMKKRVLGCALALAGLLLVTSIWYGPARRHLIYTLSYQAQQGTPPFEPFYYPLLVCLMAGWLVVLVGGVLLAGLAWRAARGKAKVPFVAKEREALVFFALWAAIPLGVFSFLPVVNMEVTLPIMPAVAIVIAAAASRLLGRAKSALALGGLAALLLIACVRALPVMGLPFEKQLYEPRFSGTDRAFDSLIDELELLPDVPGTPAISFVPFADIYFGDKVFQYYAHRHRYRFVTVPYWFDHLCGDRDPESAAPLQPVDELVPTVLQDRQFLSAMKHADLVLVNWRDKTLRDHERLCLLSQATKRILDNSELSESFAPRGSFAFPGGSRIYIYQRTDGKAPPATDPAAREGATHPPRFGGRDLSPVYGQPDPTKVSP